MELRPLTAGDAAAVLELLSACDLVDLGEVDVELSDIVEGWDGVDLARDGRFAPGTAYALRGETGAELYVHPSARGAGIEARLLDFLEAGPHPVAIGAPDSSAELSAQLAARGYAIRFAVVRMIIDLADLPPGAPWPEGFAPRPFRPGTDDEGVHAVVAPGMQEVDGRERPLEAWRREMLGRSAFAPDASVVVDDPHGGVAAAAVCDLWDGGARGSVRQLAVRRERRGLGLASAALGTAFAAFAAAGAKDAVLGVHEHNPGARRIYERAGMRPLFRFQEWTRG